MDFLRGFSLVTLATLLTYAIGFATSVLLADGLGREQYGTLKVWTTALLLITLVLGEWLYKGNTYLVGRERGRGPTLAITCAYAALVGVVLWACLPAAMGLWVRLLPSATSVQLHLLAAVAALTILERGGLAICLGEERFQAYALVPLLFAGAYFCGNLALSCTAVLSVDRVLTVWLAAVSVSVLLLVGLLARGLMPARLGLRPIFAQMVRIGARAEINLVLTFLLLKSDVFLISYLLGEEAVGVYGVATNFTEMMQRVPNVAAVVLFAKVVRGQENARLSLRVGQSMLLFLAGSAAVLVVFGPALLRLFFPRYPDAYVPLLWLLPGIVFSGVGSVFNAKLFGEGYPPVTIWAPALALAANVALNLWLIPVLGLRGAGLSTSIAYALWGTAITASFLRRSGIGWRQALRPPGLLSMLRRRAADWRQPRSPSLP